MGGAEEAPPGGADLEGWADDLRGFFGRRVRDPDDADDLAQETFVRALARWADLRRPEARRAWLFTIAHNVLRDHYREAARAPVPTADLAAGSAVLRSVTVPGSPPTLGGTATPIEPGLRAAIRAGLAALPPGQRHVLLLRLWDDLSFADIARRLGIPEATAHTRAHYGLRRLRAAVAAHLRREGLLMECAAVRDRLLRVGFGLGREDVGLAVERHLAACARCREEAAALARLTDGVEAEVGRTVVVAGFDMRAADGAGTRYFLQTSVNGGAESLDEWGVNTGGDPDAMVPYDAGGRRLPERRRWRLDDGRWGLRFGLHRAWRPGEALRIVCATRDRLAVRPRGDHWRLDWAERPLDAAFAPAEVLYRWAVQLPAGCRSLAAGPAPDHVLAGDRLVAWSAVVAAGETVRFMLEFTDGVARPAVPLRFPESGAAPSDPGWRWSPPADPYLAALRREHRLDEVVAGARDDYARVVRICHWTHTRLAHDGNTEAERGDPASILREAAAGRRFRCVEYAVVIAGCLTALGIPARKTHLLTADAETSPAGAAHAVAEAFLPDRGRWVFADGQVDAVARLGAEPLDAVALQGAIARRDPGLAFDGLVEDTPGDYASWLFPYLHFFVVDVDNRVAPSDRLPPRRLLAPEGSEAPRVFQGRFPMGEVEVVRDPRSIYPVPGPRGPDRR